MKTKFSRTPIYCRKKISIAIMRAFIFLFCMVAFGFGPKTGFSQNTKIKIDADDLITVEQVFELIRQQTDHTFIYRSDLFVDAPKVAVKKGKIRANELLQKSLSFGNFDFQFSDSGSILLERKPTTPKIEVQQSVSGTVVDSNGAPLPGANVLEKGTTNGTQSDFDGNFTINVADEDAVLVVSYIGFSTKEVSVAGQSNIRVALQEDAESLAEVVLVGYGTQRKEELTAAITSVDVEEIQKIPTADIATAMQGQVAGLNVAIASGVPGSDPVIRIRGLGTIGNNNPLFVIDGIPGDLSYVNPADIKNISILKDASAATIYGSRASNGVVIVTTKRGRSGEPRVTVNSFISTHTITNDLDVASRDQHNQIKLESYANAGETPAPYITNGTQYADSDWSDAYLKSGFEQKHDVSISGGTEQMNYNFSGGYYSNTGTIIKTDYNRINTRLNMDFKLFDDRLKVSPGIGFSRKNRENFSENLGGGNAGFSPLLSVYTQLPHKSIYDANTLNGFATPPPELGSENPVGLRSIIDNKNQDDYLQFTLSAELQLFDGLSYQFQYGGNVENVHRAVFVPLYDFGPQSNNDRPSLFERRSRTNEWTLNNMLNYQKQFGNHDLGVLLGASREESHFRSIQGENNELSSDQLDALSAGIGDQSIAGFNSTSTLQSLFGRLNYNFANKYYLQSSVRRDGSSRFGPDNKYGTFYSVSLGWAVHNEDFFNSEIISQLKPRFSYGILGNQLIGDHLFLTRIGSGGQRLNYPFGEGVSQAVLVGALSTTLPTPDIQWEETATTNFGVDLGILDNKFRFTFDYFTSETDGMLVNVPIPASSGITIFPLTNGGNMENKGWEVSAAYSKNEGDFNFDVTANFSGSKNEITKLGIADEAFTDGFIEFNNFPTTRTEVGGEVGRFYLFQADGIFQNQAEIDAHGVQPDAAPGDLRFTDTNGDGVLGDDDKQYFGSGLPKLEYGLTFNAEYKNFDLSLFFQGVSGNKIYNGVKMWLYRTDRNNMSADLVNAWSTSNTGSGIPRNVFGDPNNNIRPSSYFLEDGDYLRLKNLQIGYTLPESIVDKTFISSARLYFTANNLLTLTNYSGFDPGLGNGGTFTRGVDRGYYPLTKSFVLGINVSL
ncbi:SusC/RagA family TonB-linked outer membrane protein [Flagellimonas pacifica]|uniref:TonB-linked outer membrane protein, SusC/RagA family n=1 Tax=Flagellimonas pacifica TaxID=1247520 RepID=A0A285MTJ3_9FLAO|nr:TonB-dependent receptor [Allomuricauda parva]SNZ00448.1 TonB-linked outer membrane protein, SusC/RagA family [Allomuricauda parva]